MKNCISLLISIVVVSSCTSYRTVSFSHYEATNSVGRKIKCYLRIPNNYKYKGIKADAESGKEQEYWYEDSSVIYITNFGETLNINNIQNQKLAYSKRFSSDSASFEGVLNNKYWKEIKYLGLFYGYSNVPQDKKQEYDNILNSINCK